jgi:hypothetical protein
MHYAHTDGGVSAIRCLDQSVDEPPDSPARAPSRCLSGSYSKPLLPELSRSKVFPELANSQQPRTFAHRLLLFLLTERGLNEDFLTSVCEHSEILGWFAPDVHRNIRFLLALMLNVEVPVSYQLSGASGSPGRHRKRNNE